jgi:hypothetical protein
MPTDSPRRSAGARRAASDAPSTVSTANPRPRTAESTDSQPSPSSTAYSGDGAPRAIRPAASTRRSPKRAVAAGTADCPAIVTSSSAAVTRPARLSSAPPSAA